MTHFLFACVIFFGQKCAAAPGPWQEQQQSQSGQQSPPPPPAGQSSQSPTQPTPTGEQPEVKKKKVWTEDEVILLRTPADTYQVEKEAKEAADAKAAAQEAARRAQEKFGKQPGTIIKLPTTIEDTEKKLKDTQRRIQAQSDVLDNLQAELLSAPDDQQAEKRKQIDQLIANMEALKLERKGLQDHLQSLQEKAKPEPPTTAPLPPPSSM